MSNLYIEDMCEFGEDTGRGNLLGIQPCLFSMDYASEEMFRHKLEGYMSEAKARGWVSGRTVVVFPEYIGTWLVAANEEQRVWAAECMKSAMLWLMARHPFAFVKALLLAHGKDRVKDGLFRMKAASMAAIYQHVFSRLAREYGATIVAGSIVLPSPLVESGQLLVGRGFLHNIAALYRADGSLCAELVRKAFPTAEELPFTAPGKVEDLPVYATPVGKLAVLICADSWYPEAYRVVKDKGAEVVVVPSFSSHEGLWSERWGGYSGAPAPPDVALEDIGALTEHEAWMKYAMAGRLIPAGIRYGLNVFLRGRLWDMGSDGHTVIVRDGQVLEAEHVYGAAIINFWL